MALMKKRSALRLMMVALVATSFLQLHARVHLPAAQVGESSSGGGEPCCDFCTCTRSIPPQCQCRDVGVTCHPGCNQCVCAYSEPPQCSCYDIKHYCEKKCTAPYAPILEAIATAV